MPTPSTRTPVRIARGSYSNLNSSISDLQDGEIVYAEDQDKLYVKEGSSLVVLTQPPASPTFTGDVTINAQGDLRFADSDSSNYVGFQSPATVTSNVVWTLPAADGSANYLLKTDGSGNLGWVADSSTDNTKLPLAGGTMSGDINLGTNDITNGGTITGTFSGNVTGNVTGNADTATALATARTIGGVSFDGTANINLAGVNAAGNQDTSGTAALSTEVTVTANNSTDETVYPLFVDGATGSQGAETDTGLTYNPSSGLLTSTGFAGALTGNVTGNCSGSSGSCTGNAVSADTVDTTNIGTNATHYLTFTTGGAAATIGVTGSLEYNPSTNIISCGSVDVGKRYTGIREAITQSATPTIDCSQSNYFTLTQNQNVTSWTLNNVPPNYRAYALTIELQNASYSTAWTGFTNLKWNGGNAPTLAASKAHLIMFITDDGGSNWRGAALIDYTV